MCCWTFPAQLKALMDRHYCLVKPRPRQEPIALMQGKRVALLVTCYGGAENSADLIQALFEREAALLRASMAGMYVVSDYTTPTTAWDRARELIGHSLSCGRA